MSKVKIGIFGAGRGLSIGSYCKTAKNAEMVALCDFNEIILNKRKEELKDYKLAYYTDFDEFIGHDMDAVVIANYADEHAEYAIKALKKGKHVLSEVLPVQNMSEAVRLVEAVEASDKIYAYAENYCFMPAPREMRKKYREGLLGEFEYGEGEYFHNCEPIWPRITQGNPDHWRNHVYATFYCTHSIGPLIFITGLRPVKVTGFEFPYNERNARMGCKSGFGGMEVIRLSNGTYIKSIHAVGCSRNSVWYSIYGSKGRMESAREDANAGAVERIYVNTDDMVKDYFPSDELSEMAREYGHGGSDYYVMYNFVERIRGDKSRETIDVYTALDMFLPGLFAYRSILKGGIPMDVPDLRQKHIRELYRYDTACVSPKAAGNMLLPSYSQGEIIVPDEVYERARKAWLEMMGVK